MYYSVAITKKCKCERQKQILARINLALNDEAQYFSRIFTKLQLAQAHISFFFHKKITININGFEILINEGLEGSGHFSE